MISTIPDEAAAPAAAATREAAALQDARARLQRAAGNAFVVGDPIGRGGFADVFRARDTRLGRTVALKVLRPDVDASADAIERFRREARSIAALSHPHILPIHDIHGDDDVVFLVLAYVEGESLDALLERERRLPVDEAARLLRDIADGLGAAHRAGIVHRDVKPANVLLEGSARRVLLTDFGVARAMTADDATLTRTGSFVGTPHYLSPEQAAGDASDHRTDLYSLGVIGYRMLTGVLPFDGPVTAVLLQHLTRTPKPIRELRPDCPVWFANAVERCLAKSAEERWQTAEEVVRALDAPGATAGGPMESGHPTAALPADETVRRFRRQTRTAAALGVGALIVDVLITRSVTVSLLVWLACVAWLALRMGRLWVQGHAPRDLFGQRESRAPSSTTEEFGRHAVIVRRARATRTRIALELSELSNVERARLRPLIPAVDHLVARVVQLARRMGSVDERVGAERARRGLQASSAAAPTRLLGELLSARARLEQELADAEGVLARLLELVQRAGSLDGAAVARELGLAVAAAESLGRTTAETAQPT